MNKQENLEQSKNNESITAMEDAIETDEENLTNINAIKKIVVGMVF